MTHSISYRRILNKMGYYNYHSALLNRIINQEGGWDGHCERTRSFILKALDSYKPEKVTVLGSGWLLDLPLAEMIEKTGKISLIDIVHPPEVIKQVGTLRNIELLEEDVTGGLIEEVWFKTKNHSYFNKLNSLERLVIPEYRPLYEPGLVISLNILTQLEYQLVEFLRQRARIEEDVYLKFSTEIQKKHIDFLKKHNSILISDYAEVYTDKSGSVKTIPTINTDLPDGHFREEWTWQFEQTDAWRFNSTSVMKVLAQYIL